MSTARAKGATAAAWETTAGRDVSELVERRMPEGISIWSLGSIACVIESLSEDAPAVYVEIIRQRVWANLSGRCPACNAVADVRAGSRGVMQHESRCTVGHPPAGMARYIDPAAVAGLTLTRTASLNNPKGRRHD